MTTGTKNVNNSIIDGGKLSLLYKPTDRLTITLAGIIQDISNHGGAYQTNLADGTVPQYGLYRYSAARDLNSTLKYRVATAEAAYDLGFGTVTGDFSYGRYRTALLSDSTPQLSPIVDAVRAAPVLGGLIPPNYNIISSVSPNMDKYTGELRFVSKRVGNFEYVVGGFYTHESNLLVTAFNVNSASGAPITAPFDNLFHVPVTSDYTEEAGYVDLTYYVTSKLDITGGVRYSHNHQFVSELNPGDVVFYAPPAQALNVKYDDSNANYLATARWRPTRQVSTYFRFATGYRPGGPQNNPAPPVGAPTTVDPDTTKNYEAGVKTEFFNNRLNVNASVYRIDWDKIQLNALFNGVALQSNGGRARVEGVELEGAAKPYSSLTLGANLAYTDARFVQVDPAVNQVNGVSRGDKLPYSARWSAAFVADQAFRLAPGLTGDVGATLAYRDIEHTSYPGSPTNPDVKAPALTTLNLRAGVTFKNYSVQLRADNVTNALGYTSFVTSRLFPGQPVPTLATVSRPRTLTLSVSATF